MSIMKRLHAQWVIGLYDYLRNTQDTITKGFGLAVVTDAISMAFETEDPFTDLDYLVYNF